MAHYNSSEEGPRKDYAQKAHRQRAAQEYLLAATRYRLIDAPTLPFPLLLFEVLDVAHQATKPPAAADLLLNLLELLLTHPKFALEQRDGFLPTILPLALVDLHLVLVWLDAIFDLIRGGRDAIAQYHVHELHQALARLGVKVERLTSHDAIYERSQSVGHEEQSCEQQCRFALANWCHNIVRHGFDFQACFHCDKIVRQDTLCSFRFCGTSVADGSAGHFRLFGDNKSNKIAKIMKIKM